MGPMSIPYLGGYKPQAIGCRKRYTTIHGKECSELRHGRCSIHFSQQQKLDGLWHRQSWVKKCRGQKVALLQQAEICKFPTEEDLATQTVNFAP